MDEPEDVDEEQEDDCVPAPIVSFPFGRTHLPAEEMMLSSLPFTVLTQAEAIGADIVMSQQAPRMEVACKFYKSMKLPPLVLLSLTN